MRHAQSEANRQRIMASCLAFPLSEAGHADALRIANEFFQEHSLDMIVTSPLVRAYQTAEPFGQLFKLPIYSDDRLKEQDQGIYSGKSYDQVKVMPSYETRTLARWNWTPEGGESYSMVADRVVQFFSDYSSQFIDKNALLVTHAVAFRMIRGALQNTLPIYEEGFPNNGEIWMVDFQGLGSVHKISSLFYGDSRNFVHKP